MTTDAEARKLVKRLIGYTSGPWRVGPVDDTRVEDSLGNEVAQIDGDYNQPETWPVMEANARLIAAAPDLHTALTAALAEVERLRRRLHRIAQPGRTIAYCQDGHEEAVLIARVTLKGADDD